jgi:hypothetical protein
MHPSPKPQETTGLVRGGFRCDPHESSIRGVVDFAREVRLQLRDAQVIFGSITETTRDNTGSFRIRPWGLRQSLDIRFMDVAVAATVRQMGWTQHRAIATAQQAGVFTSTRKVDK